MSRPRRFYIANKAYFASARIAAGLPFIPDPLINEFVEGVLARGQHLYPIKICHYLFMGNHFHMIFVCKDATTVKDFFSYIKGQIAVGINKLTGKIGTVWQGRNDSPILLTPENILEKIAYLYTNPQSANLVNKIDEYHGISSWHLFLQDIESKSLSFIKTSLLQKIPRVVGERRARKKILSEIKNTEPLAEHKLELDFWLCLNCQITNKEQAPAQTKEELKASIIKRIKEIEAELASNRKTAPLGAKALKNQSLYKKFYPKKYERKCICICFDAELRSEFKRRYRLFIEECKLVYESWKTGDLNAKMPPGAFAPPFPTLASAIY